MFSDFDTSTRQILTGNLLVVACCIFYLAWWLIAFHPTHAIKGLRSGWLLVPAFIFGIWAVVEIIMGCDSGEDVHGLLPGAGIGVAAIIIYVILFAGTLYFLKRQVTTELFLIVGWAALMFLELSMLYGYGHCSMTAAIVLMVITVIAAAVSIVCYILYYNLDAVTGYIDGMIPLLLAGIMMLVVTGYIAAAHHG